MKGHVELVMVHNENYWSIFVDGQHYGNTNHADYTKVVFRSTERKNLAKMAGVNVEDLRYSVYGNFFDTMYKVDPYQYDCNDYLEDYQAFATAVVAHKISPDPNASKITLEELENINE